MMPKFRVWDKENDRMLIPGEDSDCITLEIDENGINVYDMEHPSAEKGYDLAHLDCELMQSTGLKDKNGTEIYEGDIVHVNYRLGTVKYTKGSFYIKLLNSSKFILLSDFYFKSYTNDWILKILGNIYQHPELLERE